jgi:hypothetical protein
MPNTARRTTLSTLQAGAEQVAYDIRMLVYSAGILAGAWEVPGDSLYGPGRLMAMECFVLHYRNLGLFLCSADLERDEIRAADYGVSLNPTTVRSLLADHPRHRANARSRPD